jgi:acetyl-CoA acetyltransferase
MSTQPVPMKRQQLYELSHGKTLSEQARIFAKRSREKAEKFAQLCAQQIVPISYIDRKKGEVIISEDEWLNEEQKTECALSPYADGVAVTLLMSEEKAQEWNIKPKGEILSFAVSGCNPQKAHSSGAAAVKKLFARTGLTMENIACVEVMENSAEDVFEMMCALGGNSMVNPLGGALAYGKNDGAEGIAMLLRLLAWLKSGQLGIACTYSAGGQGMAALVRKT